MKEIEERARALARARGHRDIDAEITTATGAKKPVWQFYIDEAALRADPQSERKMTDLHAEAIAQGYKDETCAKCGTIFLAHIHFVRCDAKPCPMVSTKEPRSILERLIASGHSDDM